MSITTLRITGMTCGHCVAAVTKALQGVAGVESAQVNLEREEGVVKGSAPVERLIEAVEGEGYHAEVVRT
ncbi:CopZ family metallochaperone [Acidiferrobacter thiooxydans]|jgi:copper chaperone|uniref:Heavy metal-binding protein n=1 Tax=Acidiferrobacter thiooxydans TaxID=163359 RepID=A0A1C2G496_9GAMM|nr:cation transporter [Acidiferrobacter thiooxydans]RCN55962.1 heavy metal-binding protein [Acidiferrobacter thiooxydans]UEN98769.1 cation transporter [Acidiferrobacter thiooxydans]